MGQNKTRLAGPKPRLFIPAAQFGFLPAAPTITVVGGEAGTVSIGIDSDADDAALSKTAATTRTGITGVQAPEVQSLVSSGSRLAEISTSGYLGALMGTNESAIAGLPIPAIWDRLRPLRWRAFWSTASTTTTQVVSLKCSVARFLDGATLSAPGSGPTVTDNPDSGAHSLMVSDWSSELSATWNALTAHPQEFMGVKIERNVSGDTLSGNFFLIGVELEAYARINRPDSRENADAGAWIGE